MYKHIIIRTELYIYETVRTIAIKKTIRRSNNNIAAFAVLPPPARLAAVRYKIERCREERRGSRTTARAALAEVVEPATQLHARTNTRSPLSPTPLGGACTVQCAPMRARCNSPRCTPCRPPSPDASHSRAHALVVPRPTFRLSLPSHARTRIVIAIIAVIDFPPDFWPLLSACVAAPVQKRIPRVGRSPSCQKKVSYRGALIMGIAMRRDAAKLFR